LRRGASGLYEEFLQVARKSLAIAVGKGAVGGGGEEWKEIWFCVFPVCCCCGGGRRA